MTDTSSDDCKVLVTFCLTTDNNKSVKTYQEFVKAREKKVTFTKAQAINRIIKEWAEDRHLTLEVTKK